VSGRLAHYPESVHRLADAPTSAPADHERSRLEWHSDAQPSVAREEKGSATVEERATITIGAALKREIALAAVDHGISIRELVERVMSQALGIGRPDAA